MSTLPYGATITAQTVEAYSHLKEPFRSRWIQCITCRQVPTETVYSVYIPSQSQGDKRSHGVRTECCSEECAHKWIANYEPHFFTPEERAARRQGSEKLPTQETKEIWIQAFRKQGEYPESTERSGKWLIWLQSQNIDRYWQAIREAVEQGKLGDQAKVSTAASKQVKQGKPYVICVYTYDYDDKPDVMRIREGLRNLGIRREIPYKADEDTSALRYGNDYMPKYRA
jgi:hypothetical protein